MATQTLPFFQVDAFADRPLAGNPAAVLPLQQWLEDSVLQAIAQENNLSETAFFVQTEGTIELRWFTPAAEVDLCGHATLASAHVLFHHLGFSEHQIHFATRSGLLRVERLQPGKYQMDFPLDEPQPFPQWKEKVAQSLGQEIVGLWKGKDDLLALLSSPQALKELTPTLSKVAQLPGRGLIATAAGIQSDFASRCFYPKLDVPEDPVTGSAHTLLAPFWAARLGRQQLKAQQWSVRGGDLLCDLSNDRVYLTGSAVTVIQGQFSL